MELPEPVRVTLLVVPPEASAPAAHAALMAAGHRGNTDHVEALLWSVRTTSEVLDSADAEAEAAQQRWERSTAGRCRSAWDPLRSRRRQRVGVTAGCGGPDTFTGPSRPPGLVLSGAARRRCRHDELSDE